MLADICLRMHQTLMSCGELFLFVLHMDPDAVFSAFANELTHFVVVDTIPKLSAIYCTA